MSSLLTVTLVRHGESTDNRTSIWAGWKDAPLSNHGMNQAKACGEALSTTHFKAIHASPLKRAFSTAQAVYDAQPEPKPSFDTSLLLREQTFGVAEGNTWSTIQTPGLSLEEHFAQGIYPILHERQQKFPGGESLDDLGVRATEGVDKCVMPHIWEAARSGEKGGHIAIVSHGLFISEMVSALLRKGISGGVRDFRGLLNTAWTRITIDIQGWDGKEPLQFSDNDLPPLTIKVVQFNQHDHLDNARQKGGIGSAAYDPKQQDIRAFFGGGKIDSSKTSAATEEGRSESNALDEANVDIQ